MKYNHQPVLLKETINALNIKEKGIYVDATLGGGGHSFHICRYIGEEGQLIGIDQDSEAICAANKRLEKDCNNFKTINDNFKNIKNILSELDIESINGAIMDLGVSSYQLDKKERGFSYQHDAPLDMRMNTNDTLTAYKIVNTYNRERLEKIIYGYGEERWAKRIVDFIIQHRKKEAIETTIQLSNIIKEAIPASARRIGPHPAKRTFQAIRIEVNNELNILNKSIKDFVDLLKTGGRLAIITFHSLEDRIVKKTFTDLSNPCECPAEFPVCICNKQAKIKIISKKPIVASAEELEDNHRARSAKLRVIEKI